MPQYNRENLKGSNVEYNTVHNTAEFCEVTTFHRNQAT